MKKQKVKSNSPETAFSSSFKLIIGLIIILFFGTIIITRRQTIAFREIDAQNKYEQRNEKVYTSLDDAYRNPSDVYHLDLSIDPIEYQRQGKTPPTYDLTFIYKLNNLENLNLAYTNTQILPAKIAKLGNLRILNLEGTQMKSIPASIWNLHSLTSLNLANLNLGAIPKDINRLRKLEYLNLAGNQLTGLPQDFNKILRLKELVLDNNNFANLPLNITQIRSLRKLSLSQAPVKSLPPEVSNLQNLTYLNLSGCEDLKQLPYEFITLRSLEDLDISYSGITSLPLDLGQMENLKTISAVQSKLISLPESTVQLTKLRQLNLLGSPVSQNKAKLKQLEDSLPGLKIN